ncbi:GerAB/ArcD/ProY family transporter [Crassaminicella indica]|uniref:Endospore germination permease n=1 Tax=Crassaminicella indica TaxID=2855394 RepID=A0ABX8R8S0_9CLOT|nr:endospore germination permease [Crassaminicella indica]QXM05444.1 endospore germination permease [Crassaminicella indica]
MNKEVISNTHGISLIVLFIIGSSSVFIMGLEAGKDLWLAIIFAIFMAIPFSLIYIKLHNIFHDKNLFDIIEICFGKILGKGIILLFTCFMFYWTSDVLVNFGNFISTISLIETPKIIPMIFLLILCAWVVKEKIEVLGRWSAFLLIVAIFIIFLAIILLIPKMNINNILPIFNNGIHPIVKGALNTFSFPFSQIIAFSIVFSSFNEKKSSYKIYIIGLLLGGFILFIISSTNILVLGINEASRVHYPTYHTFSRINIGNTFQRTEAIILIIFVLGGFVKISILLLCTCKGIAQTFNCKDHRFIIIPVSLLVINLSYFQYDSVMHYSKFQTDTWFYFTFPFQGIFPIILFIIAILKKKAFFNN